MTTSRCAALAWILAVAVSSAAGAQGSAPAAIPDTTTAPAPGWDCLLEPYLLVPTITGTSGVGGLTADIDAGSGDIFGALDVGAMLYFEVHNPTWAFALDFMYMDLGASAGTRLGSVELDLKQGGVMAMAYRRVAPWSELMAGVQFNSIECGLTGSGPAGVDLSGTQNWADPYFGLRLTLPRTDRWRFVFMGAIGGFGVGSDFAWQVFPQIGYRFHRHFELTGAFRVLDMKYDNGTGAQQFLYDLTTYGPQVGARFHF